jgi:hypothetical protein
MEIDQGEAGRGTVSVGGTYGSTFIATTKEHAVCALPCVVDLPIGGHELRFIGHARDAVSRDYRKVVNATPNIESYRVALGETTPPMTGLHLGGAMLEGLGITGIVLGGTFIALSQKDDRTDSVNVRPAGIAMAAAGLGTAVLGIVLQKVAQGARREGDSTHWTTSARSTSQ